MHFPSNPSIPQVTFLSALTLLLRAAVCFPLLAAMFLRVRTMALAALSSPAGRASRQPRTQFLAVALTAAVLAFLAPTAQAAAGDLDPLNPTLVGNYVLATTVQPDGKLILAGKFTSVLGVTRNNLARLNADGTLDSTFNPNPNGDVNSVTVQPDGRILIGGSFSSVISTTRNRIARLNADGTLDTVFNPNANGAPMSIVLQADGKVLLGGDFTTLQPNGAASATTRNRIARVNADGTLDTGFDPNASDRVISVAVQADGKMVISGYFLTLQPNGAASATTRNRIARLNADGTLDTGFNPNANNFVNCLALEPDGQILLGGDFTTLQPNGAAPATTRNRIARLNADGTLDTGFDPNANGSLLGIAVQADGKVLLGGYFTTLQPNGAASATTRNLVARVNADGSLDTPFNPNTKNPLFTIALQADGKALLGGFFSTLQPNGAASATPRNLFARVENDMAASTVSVSGSTQVLWTRSGSAPEVSRVTFELSTNSGTTWSPLGNGTRVGTTSNWQLTGLSLPASGVIRARGATTNGYFNGSSGLVEATVSFPTPPSDPVVWLKAESNAADATAFGNNGVVSGSVPYVAGRVGNAFSFSGVGSNRVRIPNSASLQSPLLTVEYRIYFNSVQNSINVTKRNSGGAGDAWQTGIAYSGGNFIFQFVGSTSGGLFDWYSGALSSPVGVWTHVAATYDGTTVKGYVNGTQVLTQAVALNLSTRNADIHFGAYPDGSFALNGNLDELSIYNRALSATEIQAIYQAGSAGKPTAAPAPTVTSISPTSGTTLGGTSVTLTGTNLTGATGVTIGGAAATGVTVVNATTITATTPAGTAGTASVIITTPGGSNSANSLYTYFSPAPTLTSISPASGSTLGGTSVTLTGTNFTGATSVTFGGTAATNVTVINATTITATTPAGTAGTASVVVTTPGGSNAANSLYTYFNPVVTATYTSANMVPVTAAGYTASGRTLNFTLGYAPAIGTTLTVVKNTSLGFINGTFSNLAQGQAVALSFGGRTYNFVANYYGGTGNDLVLLWAGTRAVGWGSNQAPAAVPTGGILAGKTVIALAVGQQHKVALCSDGTLAAWGLNQYGQLGDSTSMHSITGPVAVTTSGALAGKTVIAVSAGFAHTLALCSDGTVVAWGSNDSGQLGNASNTGRNFPVAVTTSGALAGKTVVAVAAGSQDSLALCSDGTVVNWGSRASSNVPVAVTTSGALAGKTVNAIAMGQSHSVALCSDGTLATWGGGQYGQLGNDSFLYSAEPVAVTTITGALSGRTVVAVAAGGLHSLALCSDGTLAAWGLNEYGQFGNNGTASSSVPVAVTTAGTSLAGKSVIAISAGDIHCLALCPDGTLSVWGGNFNGQLGDGGTTQSLVPKAFTTSMLGGGRFVAATSGSSSTANLALVATGFPTVTGVSPFSGSMEGGTSVTITGTDFTGATGVTFGGTAATGVTVVNDTTITATTPAGTVGTASVLVTTPGGSNVANSLYTYLPPVVVVYPPTVTGASPTSGTTYGGTSVTISGTDFTDATAVTFGGTAAAGFSVINATTITAVTPARAAGSASVVVTTAAGSNAANAYYTFTTPPAPTVTGVSPTLGVRLGGTSVRITGTDFTGATAVTFGGVAASFSVVDVNTITATTPGGTAGTASIVVTTPSGSNAANTLYTFVPPAPTLTSVSPNRGVDVGGTTVTLTGTDFTGATSVKFGTREASSFTVVNSTTITAVTDTPYASGAVSVVVTTPYGSNAANPLYTFYPRTPTNTQLSSSQFTSAFLSPPTFIASVSTLGGAPVPGKIALYIDNVLLESKAVDAGGWAYFTPTPAQLPVGTRVIRAIYNGDAAKPDYFSSEAGAIGQTVNKSPQAISIDSATLTQTYDGTPRPVTATTGTLPPAYTGSGVQVDITYNGSATVPTNAGTYAVVATINDPILSGSASGTLTVNKATGTYTVNLLGFPYDGQPKQASVTVNPPVPVTVTYQRFVNNLPSGAPSANAPVNVGNYSVFVDSPNYTFTQTFPRWQFTIYARSVPITIGNLEAVSDSQQKAVTITTIPPGINVQVRYQRPGQPIPTLDKPYFHSPESGSVFVEAVVDQIGYAGKSQAFMNFAPKGTVALSLTGPASGQTGPQTYQVSSTGRIQGRGMAGTVTLLKGTGIIGSGVMADNGAATVTTPILAPGPTPYAISVRYEGNGFYLPATSNTVSTTINKAPLTLTPNSPLTLTYDGRGKSVSFKGPGVPPLPVAFDVTYGNSTTLPVNVTTTPVQVRAIIKSNDPSYTGTTTVPLTINPAPATLTLGSLSQSFDGTPKPVSVTTTPPGLASIVYYNGSTSPPSAPGSYPLSAQITDPNYTAAPVSGLLNISNGPVRIEISDTNQNFTSTKDSYPVTVKTTPPVAYSVTYNGLSYDVPGEKRGPYGAGTYNVVVNITQPNYTGTASATLKVNPQIKVNYPQIMVYGSNFTNQGNNNQGYGWVSGSIVSPGTPFTFLEGSRLRFEEFLPTTNPVRYRFVKWEDGDLNQERAIEANTRVYTPLVRPEFLVKAEAYTKIAGSGGSEPLSAVGGTVLPATNGRAFVNEKETVAFVATPNPGYVVDRWEFYPDGANPYATIYSLKTATRQFGTEYQEQARGFPPVKVVFTKGYTVTTGVNVSIAGSVKVVRQDGYGYNADGSSTGGRTDPMFTNTMVPEGINVVAQARSQPGYLFNTWIVEGGGPASLPDYPGGYTPGYYAAMTRSTQTFKPFPGSGGLKLTAVFVREVPGPVASFSRINSVGINIGVAELSLSRSPILLIANEGTGPLINARITGVEITGARLKIANNEAGEINTGGFFEFYQPPAFRPLTPEETATPDPYNIRYTQYGGIMVASKPQLTAPGNAITASNPINIGTLNPGQDREFNNLQYAWVKANVGFGAPIGGVSFSFLQYRVTIWITADNFETAPVSFWTN